uniref:Uncharacterized protein n=1 Tax=Mycena chlorophos TaxID=658473 RepID=A0ABQ0L9M1_MYCCL|nr:predicted protein [Mycena chlorophos]
MLGPSIFPARRDEDLTTEYWHPALVRNPAASAPTSERTAEQKRHEQPQKVLGCCVAQLGSFGTVLVPLLPVTPHTQRRAPGDFPCLDLRPKWVTPEKAGPLPVWTHDEATDAHSHSFLDSRPFVSAVAARAHGPAYRTKLHELALEEKRDRRTKSALTNSTQPDSASGHGRPYLQPQSQPSRKRCACAGYTTRSFHPPRWNAGHHELNACSWQQSQSESNARHQNPCRSAVPVDRASMALARTSAGSLARQDDSTLDALLVSGQRLSSRDGCFPSFRRIGAPSGGSPGAPRCPGVGASASVKDG